MGGFSRMRRKNKRRALPVKKVELKLEPRYSIAPIIGLTGQKKSVQLKKNKKAARRAKNRGHKVAQKSPNNHSQRYAQRYTRGNR
jgi:hypothetical protein